VRRQEADPDGRDERGGDEEEPVLTAFLAARPPSQDGRGDSGEGRESQKNVPTRLLP
jgi:hypothetical protein